MDQGKLAKLINQERSFKEKFGDSSSDDAKSTKKTDDNFDPTTDLTWKILTIVAISVPVIAFIVYIADFLSIK